MLVAYPLPDKGNRYTVRRGSGLFISCWAFGDASCKINKNNIPRFFSYSSSRVNSGMEATVSCMKKLFLLIAMVVGLATAAKAELKATAVTEVYPDNCPKVAMEVDSDGLAVFYPAVVYASGNDRLITKAPFSSTLSPVAPVLKQTRWRRSRKHIPIRSPRVRRSPSTSLRLPIMPHSSLFWT